MKGSLEPNNNRSVSSLHHLFIKLSGSLYGSLVHANTFSWNSLVLRHLSRYICWISITTHYLAVLCVDIPRYRIQVF